MDDLDIKEKHLLFNIIASLNHYEMLDIFSRIYPKYFQHQLEDLKRSVIAIQGKLGNSITNDIECK